MSRLVNYHNHKLQYVIKVPQIISHLLNCTLFALICTEKYMECLGSSSWSTDRGVTGPGWSLHSDRLHCPI